jgi:hypothetical protein
LTKNRKMEKYWLRNMEKDGKRWKSWVGRWKKMG